MAMPSPKPIVLIDNPSADSDDVLRTSAGENQVGLGQGTSLRTGVGFLRWCRARGGRRGIASSEPERLSVGRLQRRKVAAAWLLQGQSPVRRR